MSKSGKKSEAAGKRLGTGVAAAVRDELAGVPGLEKATDKDIATAHAYADSWRIKRTAVGKRTDAGKFREVRRNFLAGMLRRRGEAAGEPEKEPGKKAARAGDGRFKGGGLLAEECRRADASELARLRVLVVEQENELEAHRQATGDLQKRGRTLESLVFEEKNRASAALNKADVYRRALEAQSEAVLRLAELGS